MVGILSGPSKICADVSDCCSVPKKVAPVESPAPYPSGADGRREWDRTTDHYHVKVVLYH